MLTPAFWKKYFKEYDILNEITSYQQLLETICEVAQVSPGHNVLDLGSGTGNLGVKLLGSQVNITGMDFSLEGNEIFKKKLPQAKIVYGDISQSLPFDDNEFDVVISNNVLYTISRKKRLLVMNELYRVLKPKGRIVVSNVLSGFSPLSIYNHHLNYLIKEHGIIKTIYKVISLSIPTLKMFYYNYLIKKENIQGEYDFFLKDEQAKLLKNAGFKNISDGYSVYADQAVLNTAVK